MAGPTFRNFDLDISTVGDQYLARVLNSPSGQAETSFQLPFSPQELAAFTWLPGHQVRQLKLVASPELAVRPLTPQEFGSRLYGAVFAGGVGSLLLRSLDRTEQQGSGLRLRLRVDLAAHELAELPWEYLYVPELAQFPVLSQTFSLVRYVELPRAERSLRVQPPLRLLVVLADPQGVLPLQVDKEWERLTTALADLRASGVVDIQRLEPPTVAQLQRHLRQNKVHLLHFVGHGEFDAAENRGSLYFEDEAGNPHQVPADSLGVLLHDHKPLRLAFFNACEGARTGENDSFAGLAQHLVQQGVPAVIAMQFPVTDVAAIELAHVFYQALGDGYAVDAALTEARKALFAQGNPLEWGTAVLFSRVAPTNQLLEKPAAPETQAPVLPPAPLLLRAPFDLELLPIPAGPFRMGSPPGPGIPPYETPEFELLLSAYFIGKYPITSAQFEAFVLATGRLVGPELGWEGQRPPFAVRGHPVTGVSWYDAEEFCRWLSAQTGRTFTLPTEAQWEKAARGVDGRRYPWGADWLPGRSNQGGAGTTAVDAYPPQSPFGCCDLVGNVRQWTRSLWGERPWSPDPAFRYPWATDAPPPAASDIVRRVWRGGSYADAPEVQRCSARGHSPPKRIGAPGERMGLRVVTAG